ncbi:MAG TPA: STAS domain-containing protein [Spirochaetota bacterium]|nr:STAS domain-containing protein [Spirochaetota bacterium]HPS85785.1 STAS domain-containing protein [Spirochaetota bacterium]
MQKAITLFHIPHLKRNNRISMSSFSLSWKIEKNFPVIFLDGDITSEADQLLEEAYFEIRNKIKEKIYIFDFEKANYINSSGISSFIKIIHMHKEEDGDFIFTGLSDHLKKVMDIVGLTDYVKIFDTIETAIQKSRGQM